MYRKDTFLTLI